MLSPFDSTGCFTSYHVVSNYKEPGIDGHFDDCTKEVLKGLMAMAIQMKRFKATGNTDNEI